MFHKHKWKVLHCNEVTVYSYAIVGKPIRSDMEFGLLCTACGKVKKERLRDFKLDSRQAASYAAAKGWDGY